MRLSYLTIFISVLLLSGCDNDPIYDSGPCKFAPPESNFPIIQ